jgi:hypothetical protein
MLLKPLALPVLTLLATIAPGISSALEIRNYTPARHDRFTGFPTSPTFNATNWVSGVDYTGIGWSVSDPRRQFALISPQHILLSAQWPLAAGEQVRFLGLNGQVVTRTLHSTVRVQENGLDTDLLLGRLDEALSPLVTPLRHEGYTLGFAGQATPLHVFGDNAQVGAANLWDDFMIRDAGTGPTRSYAFDYGTASGLADDCHLTADDLGAPSCRVYNGKAILQGIHSAVETDEANGVMVNYDSRVSSYISQLNAIMAVDGWRMGPGGLPQAGFGGSPSVSAPLVRTQPGEMAIQVRNSSEYENGNLRVEVSFTPGTGPDSISAEGWIIDQAGPDEWKFHRATMPPTSTATMTATWNAVPDVPVVGVGVTSFSDLSFGIAIAMPFFTEAPPEMPEEPEEPEAPVLERGNAVQYTPEHASDKAHGWWNPKRP